MKTALTWARVAGMLLVFAACGTSGKAPQTSAGGGGTSSLGGGPGSSSAGSSGGGNGGSSGASGSGGSGGSTPTGDGGGSQPSRESTRLSMDAGWKFIAQDVTGAEATAFNDSAWSTVSTPHTYNDVDSYGVLINHASGDTGTYDGPAWYRKHFKVASQYSNSKMIIEFERIRQGARFYINGTAVGVYDDGVTACGIDVTGKVNFGATENVLAVRVDNNRNYAEASTGVVFEWAGKA